MTTRGRPPEFDYGTALNRAMELFWAKGFVGTSVSELLDRMGIGRQSAYNTFGDKRSLYLKAIAHYQDTVVQGMVDALQGEGSPRRNLRRFIRDAARTDYPLARLGCLCVNAIAGSEVSDKEVARLTRQHVERLVGAVHDAIRRAQALGEIPAQVDALGDARAIVNSLNGLALLRRIGADPSVLSDVANRTIAMLG